MEKAISISMGIKFVPKAEQWCFFNSFNNIKFPDIQEWFNTKEEAEERLEREKNGSKRS